MEYRYEAGVSWKLRALRDGALSVGVPGSAFGFFSTKIAQAITAGQVGLSIMAFKNTLEGKGEAMIFNIVGGVATNLLTILLHYYGPNLPEPLALSFATLVIAVCSEGFARESEGELRIGI